MFFTVFSQVSFLLTLTIHAAIILDDRPEVIPGPGLPSLESLNLTSADLYELPLPGGSTAQTTTSDNELVCGPEDSAYTSVENLIVCYHYLRSLGRTPCEFENREARALCWRGIDTVIVGIGRTGGHESSYCIDLAVGILAVIDGCTRPDGSCAGFAVANGNANIMVGGTNAGYQRHRWS